MATEYVDAGTRRRELVAERHRRRERRPSPTASRTSASSTPRSEPENWLTYYGAYDGQRYSPLDQINKENVKQLTPAVGLPVRLGGPALGQVDVLLRGVAARRRRHHVRLRLGRLGLGARRQDRQHPVAVPDRLGVRRVAVLRQREPGRRRRRRQGLRHHPGRPRHRARRRDRQEGLGHDLRGRARRRERHRGAAGRQGQGHRRQLRR